MKYGKSKGIAFLLFVSMLLCACGSTNVPLPADGGATMDGGPAVDGGPMADGGTTADGGLAVDGGFMADGGATMDGGPSADGGPSEDGGVASDGGPPEDGGVASDGGPSEDGGLPSDGGVIENCPDLLGQFNPCGGDVMNTWKIDLLCLDQAQSILNPLGSVSGCESSTFSGTVTESSGEMAFHAGGGGNMFLTVKTNVEMTYPDACLRAIASGLTPQAACSVLSTQYQNEMAGSCTYGTAKCNCMGKGTLNQSSNYTWSSSGTTLTLQESGGTPENIDYCVANGLLYTRRRVSLDRGMVAVFVSKASKKFR